MRIIFMGTPEFAVLPLQYLVSEQYQMVAVYTAPDKTAGRGRSLSVSPVKQAATELQLPVMQPDDFKTENSVTELIDWQPDVIIVAAYGQILPPSVLSVPKHGCINIHPSLLPEFRGTSPVVAAIMANKDFAGISIMLLDKGMDTGPVLAQTQISISSYDTTQSLTEKLSRISALLLLEILPKWVSGEILPRPQDDSRATYTSMLSRRDGEIDWQLPAVDIWRRVRALCPWPGAYTSWCGKKLEIIKAIPLTGQDSSEPGRVVTLTEDKAGFGVVTGGGVLKILEVQLEGKRAMSAAEFLRGQRQLLGSRLPS